MLKIPIAIQRFSTGRASSDHLTTLDDEPRTQARKRCQHRYASRSLGFAADKITPSRRSTGLFIAEFLSQGLDSERGSVSIARMNYLHSRWGPSIKQDDLLFTLALFVFEPITVIGKYEWRALTPLEEQARYVFWREIGARMGIENIPTTREAFWKWKEDYADRAMVYDAGNAQTGEATLAVLLRPFPDFLKPFVREASLVLIDDRTRNAFGWAPASPRFLYILVPAVLRLRAAFIGNLMMPRNDLPPMFKTHTKDDGSYVREGFLFEPWYIPAGYSSIGMFGIGKPGLPKFGSGKGWRPQTLGPDRLHDQGVDRSLADAAKMREAARICPFFRD